jgi:hypothetical protein
LFLGYNLALPYISVKILGAIVFALINIWQIRHSSTSVSCTIQYYSNQAKYLLAYKYIIRRDLRLKIKLFTRRDLRLNTNFIQGVVCVYTTNFIVYTRCGLHLLNTNFIQGVVCVYTTKLNTNFIQGVVCIYTTNFIVYTRCGFHLLILTI